MRIHYNVTGAERKALVKVIADTTGAKAEYKGMPTAAYEIDYFTVTKDGMLEFSDRSDSEEVETVLEALATAGFDGIGENAETDEPAEDAQEAPTEGGTESQDATESAEDNTVALTVTIPTALHTGTSLRNLVNLVYTRAVLLNKALGTAFRVDEGLVEALRDDANVLIVDRFFETLAAYEERHGKAMDGLAITRKEITFSTLPETADADILHTFTTLCAMMNKQAVTQQRIQAKTVSEENEKYAMRIWLLRLGMNGAEHKAERRVLMGNLSGHCAFRTEDDKTRWQKKQNEKRDALRAAKLADAEKEVTDDEVSE